MHKTFNINSILSKLRVNYLCIFNDTKLIYIEALYIAIKMLNISLNLMLYYNLDINNDTL